MRSERRAAAISRFASAILCLFFAAVLGARMPVIGIGFAVAGLVLAFLGYRDLRDKRDPYDLSLLKEIHEEEELRNVRVPESTGDNVMCPACGEVYTNEFPICPRCGRSGN
ncbi:MAG: hypothetical protein KIT74_03725 [Fimbriimonadales bacterium]|nr:hypothetical protein [Fimbriimonadales bacterium]